jgi:hypothetical protein
MLGPSKLWLRASPTEVELSTGKQKLQVRLVFLKASASANTVH